MITAQLATIPQRVSSMLLTVNSLNSQVDFLNVMCNNYTEREANFINASLNDWQYYRNFKPTALAFHKRNNEIGDAEKFYKVENHSGYFFTCDDDLIYPPDYVKYMISKIEQYERKAVITLHGRNYTPGRIEKYYGGRNRTEAYHCLQRVEGDHKVMIGGTGVMAFHTDTLKIKYEDFKLPNMADLWMAIVCRNQNVPIMVVEHLPNWLQVGYDGEDTIWNKHYNDDSMQTEIYNKYMI